MGFVEVAKMEELTAGKMKGMTIEGKDILITNVGGHYYAIGGKVLTPAVIFQKVN